MRRTTKRCSETNREIIDLLPFDFHLNKLNSTDPLRGAARQIDPLRDNIFLASGWILQLAHKVIFTNKEETKTFLNKILPRKDFNRIFIDGIQFNLFHLASQIDIPDLFKPIFFPKTHFLQKVDRN
jgi:hypothetical protein